MNIKLLIFLTAFLTCANKAFAMQESEQRTKRELAQIDKTLGLQKPENDKRSESFHSLLKRAHVANVWLTNVGIENNLYAKILYDIVSNLQFIFTERSMDSRDDSCTLEINCYDALHTLHARGNVFSPFWQTQSKNNQNHCNPMGEKKAGHKFWIVKPTWRSTITSFFSSTPLKVSYGVGLMAGLAALNTKYNFTKYLPSFSRK